MTRSALKQIGSLPSCGGLLSRLVYAEAKRQGVEVGILLKRAGLTPRQMRDRDAQLPVAAQVKFAELVADALGDPDLGCRMALSADPREIGLLYYVAASAETLGDALLRLERYSAIVNEGIVFRVSKGRTVLVRLQHAGIARHTDVQQIECFVAILIRVCRQLIGSAFGPVRVRLMHRRPGDKCELARLVDGNIETGAEADEVEFPAPAWDLRLSSADPYLHRMALRCCEEALARRKIKASPLRVRVENAIAALLPNEQAHADAVAAELGMSSRTLARRLAAEGLSFAAILRDLRSALAQRYLADRNLRISQIAWLLGYSEVGTFTRAFQRWTGKTPSAARAQHRRAS
jgi:AraC-like DNA-binding protein